MTLHEAFGVIIWGAAGVFFLSWYSWCWWTMLFRCQTPRAFFSPAYSTSSLFTLVNLGAVVCGAAFALYWATN